jgi:hypothetical protein
VIRLGLERFSALPMYLRFPEAQFFTVSDLHYLDRHGDFSPYLHFYPEL